MWESLLVRIGLREPLRHDEMEEDARFGLVIGIAFLFAVAANANLGLRPLLAEVGSVSLQAFIRHLWEAPANLQLKVLVDVAGMLFPPLMALAAGHLTARFAAELSERAHALDAVYEAELVQWRSVYLNPLETDEGRELLDVHLEEKLKAKLLRKGRTSVGTPDFLASNGHLSGD